MMYHLFQNSFWKVVKIAKPSDWKSAVKSQSITTVIAYQAYQARKTRLQTQNPTLRFKELIKSHENVEAIVTLLQQRATNSPNGPIVL